MLFTVCTNLKAVSRKCFKNLINYLRDMRGIKQKQGGTGRELKVKDPLRDACGEMEPAYTNWESVSAFQSR